MISIDAAQNKTNFPIPAGVFAQTVTSVYHYTDHLFKFRITRPASLRFRSGEFMMIGQPKAEKPVYRAYSVASPSWDNELDFYSIKVPGGPLGISVIPIVYHRCVPSHRKSPCVNKGFVLNQPLS